MIELLSSLFQALAPLWEMSVTAAYAAAVVAALRLALNKRAPKQVICLLWLVVFARLLAPVSLESPLSIVPDAPAVRLAETLPGRPEGEGPVVQPPARETGAGQTGGAGSAPVSQGDSNQNPVPVLTVPGGVTPAGPRPQAPAEFPWQALLAGLWLAGALTLGSYGLISYLRLRRRLFDAIRAGDGAWEHPYVGSPFILGVFQPRIYLPAGLHGQARQFILCHEQAHLKRLDHIVKPVCWAALVLHWFNPAAWAAFILMSRDIESACDEAVIRRLGTSVKADYSATLLSLATRGRVPAPCPLAFDEGDAKGRIQNVLRYRRPALWVIVVSVLLAAAASVCLLTDPVSAQELTGPGLDGPGPEVSAAQEPEALPAPSDPPAVGEVEDTGAQESAFPVFPDDPQAEVCVHGFDHIYVSTLAGTGYSWMADTAHETSMIFRCLEDGFTYVVPAPVTGRDYWYGGGWEDDFDGDGRIEEAILRENAELIMICDVQDGALHTCTAETGSLIDGFNQNLSYHWTDDGQTIAIELSYQGQRLQARFTGQERELILSYGDKIVPAAAEWNAFLEPSISRDLILDLPIYLTGTTIDGDSAVLLGDVQWTFRYSGGAVSLVPGSFRLIAGSHVDLPASWSD